MIYLNKLKIFIKVVSTRNKKLILHQYTSKYVKIRYCFYYLRIGGGIVLVEGEGSKFRAGKLKQWKVYVENIVGTFKPLFYQSIKTNSILLLICSNNM